MELTPHPDGSGSPALKLYPTGQHGAYAIQLSNGLNVPAAGRPTHALLDSGCAASVSAVIGADLARDFAHSVHMAPTASVSGLGGVPMPAIGQGFIDFVLARPQPNSPPALPAPVAPRDAPDAPTYGARAWPHSAGAR